MQGMVRKPGKKCTLDVFCFSAVHAQEKQKLDKNAGIGKIGKQASHFGREKRVKNSKKSPKNDLPRERWIDNFRPGLRNYPSTAFGSFHNYL